MLNGFPGKFGKRENIQLCEMVHVRLQWIFDDDFIETSGRTNVVIAAYTTAQARLKLYSYLVRYGDWTLYVDID